MQVYCSHLFIPVIHFSFSLKTWMLIWRFTESISTKQEGVSPHSAAWLWNQCGHVMSSFITIMTSWKSDLPQALSFPCRDWGLQWSGSALEATLGAEFDLSKFQNITNPRWTFWHRPSIGTAFSEEKKKRRERNFVSYTVGTTPRLGKEELRTLHG